MTSAGDDEGGVSERRGSSEESAVPGSSRSRGTRGPLTALMIVGLLAVWVALAGTSGLSAYRDLEGARRDVLAAERLLRGGHLSDARATLEAGVAGAARASAELHRPWVVPLRVVPVLGPNLRATTVLSDAARDTGLAASDLLAVAVVIVSDDRDQQRGEISLEYLADLGPPTRQLADALQSATAEVVALPASGLIGPVARARDSFIDTVAPSSHEALLAADVLEVLPAFLGANEPRTYLVGAAALSELRGSGGLLGSWSVLTADAGRLRFEEFVDVDEMPRPTRDVEAPSADYERRYRSYAALRSWRNANLTPDFPSAAAVLMGLWEEGGGAPVDGVITADPVVFARLAERSGGLRIPEVGAIAPGDVLRFVGLDAYEAFDDDAERKRVLGATATAALEQVLDALEDDDVPATVDLLLDLVAGGHLRISVNDSSVQAALERAGLTGHLPTMPGESVGLFANNFAGNKLDYFTSRSIDHRITLRSDGSADAEVVVEFVNGAPRDGYRRAVLGPWVAGVEAGDNLSFVTMTCSTSCTVLEASEGALDGGYELDRPMVDHLLELPAGERRQLRYRTRSEGAWQVADGMAVLEVEHLLQPTLFGSDLIIRVAIPPDMVPIELPEGARISGDEVTWSDSGRSGSVRLRWTFGLQSSAGD